VVGTVLFYNRGLKYFYLCYTVNIITAIALAFYFSSVNGWLFPGGGDVSFYYEQSRNMADAWINGHSYSLVGVSKFYGYLYICSVVYFICNYFGDMSYISLLMVNSFVGATIPPILYNLCQKIYYKEYPEMPRQVGVISALFPIMTYYSVIGLRDIWIAAITVLFIYIVACRTYGKKNILNTWVMPLMLIGFMFSLRSYSVFPLIAFWLVIILGERNTLKNFIYKYIIVLVLVLIAFEMLPKILDYFNIFDRYKDLSIAQASDKSIGKRIIMLPSPINETVRFVLALYSPIPPMKYINFESFIIGIGGIWWYFIVPVFIYGVWYSVIAKEKILFALATISFSVMLIMGVAMSSIDIRHKTQLYPIVILFYCLGISQLGKLKLLKINFFILYIISLLGLFYIYLKVF
jgi:hypothetical protein